MQHNTPEQATVLATLNARITQAKTEFNTLLEDRRMDLKKRAERLEALAQNLSGLKTLKLRYMTELRYQHTYRAALTNGVWQGKPLDERARGDVRALLMMVEDNLAEIEREVRG